MKKISENIKKLKEEVNEAALYAKRNPEDINIVAVSKRHPAEYIEVAYKSGLNLIGENRVLEAYDKFNIINNDKIQWHMIGHLQKNKAKIASKFFNYIHSLDSFQLAEKLNNYLIENKRTIKAFLQPKLSYEETKTGVSMENLTEMAEKVKNLSNIEVIGLMTIPPFTENPEDSRKYFIQLRKNLENLNNTVFKDNKLKELSMGMTNDFKIAIEEGATYIRVGTKIFGQRS